MSKNSKDATISDIRDVNRIVTKVRECGSKVKYEHIRDKDDLRRVGIGGAFLKTGDRTIGGAILFWTNSSMTRASPIHWKAKQIDGFAILLRTQRLLICLQWQYILFMQQVN